MVPYSLLDLAPIVEGSTASVALQNSRDLAIHAERWGYTRYWIAEHHNMVGIASAATSLVIAHVAAATQTMRVGAGGIMLPNHSPLMVAEQFGTLEALYPGRIDLGLGRAPGTDGATARALRRYMTAVDRFAEDVLELQSYFREETPGQLVRAVPGVGANIPLWILGSSTYGARLAAKWGLPYAFASHFAPDAMMAAIAVYRAEFQPSAQLQRPHVMLGINVFAAETDAEAAFLFTSLQQQFARLRRGTPGKLPPPVDDIRRLLGPEDLAMLAQTLTHTVIGSPRAVRQGLAAFVQRTGADELMITGMTYDPAARLRSFEIAAEAMRGG